MCTNRIYLLFSFFLFACPCLCHGGSFYINKAYLPCTLQHWANLWCQFRRKSCENFPESYKSVHSGSWHLRGLQTGLLTSYFILCLYPIATQTQPYSAKCLPENVVSGGNERSRSALSHFPVSRALLLFLLLCTYPSPFPLHPSEGLIAYVMSLNICAVLGEVRHAKTVQIVPLCTP